MKIFYFGKMVALLSIATLLCLSSCPLSTVPVNAEDSGIAISGSFYRQPFELTQGSSISGPSIYVVVFNNGESEINIRMVTLAPQKVNMILSHSDFKLAPGGQQKVFIEVEAHEDAIPGDYEILVTAESYKENQGGIQLMGAAGQSASLTITGESAKIIVKSMSPAGEPIQATIRIFKVSDGNQAEIDYSETGVLETTVPPGNFKAEAYVGGEKLAEETINLANGDEKTITLVVGTVYFASFGGVPHYHSSTGQLAFTKLIYSIKNLYHPVNDIHIILLVTHDGVLLDEIDIGSMSTLDIGSIEQSYNYIPIDGWIDGEYNFQMQLNLAGEPYIYSLNVPMDVTDSYIVKDEETGGNNTILIGGIVVGAIVIAIILGFLFLNRGRTNTKSKRHRIVKSS